MNREEMLRRLKAGEDPLDLSIEKWEDIVNHLKSIRRASDFDESLEAQGDNCALCEVHEGCRSCPVCKRTGRENCSGTPYWEFRLAWRRYDLRAMRIAAERELEFLISLKKQLMEKWN